MDKDLFDDSMWRKSSYSGGEGSCVEVTPKPPKFLAVRDSANKNGSRLVFVSVVWRRFIDQVKNDNFNV